MLCLVHTHTHTSLKLWMMAWLDAPLRRHAVEFGSQRAREYYGNIVGHTLVPTTIKINLTVFPQRQQTHTHTHTNFALVVQHQLPLLSLGLFVFFFYFILCELSMGEAKRAATDIRSNTCWHSTFQNEHSKMSVTLKWCRMYILPAARCSGTLCKRRLLGDIVSIGGENTKKNVFSANWHILGIDKCRWLPVLCNL